MNKIINPYIIGISGNMGAGKTTLTIALAKYLQCPYIIWDDFDDFSKGPEDYIDWYKRGANYNEWNYPKLAEVLKALKQGQSILHPVRNLVINPKQYIIFDAPLGKFHLQSGEFIDTWIHINVPLDVSLCRWLLRDYRNTDKSKKELLSELELYLNVSRFLFDDSEYKDKADLVINGMESTKKQVDLIIKYLNI